VEEKMKMKPNPSMAFIGGLIGTPAMTGLMYALAPVIGVNTDVATMLGEVLGGWGMGMLVHILNGAVIFPLAFAFFFYRFLPGSLVTKGIAFGVLLWLTSQLVVTPLMGAGFFSAHVGGLKAVAASLLGHVVYGWFLGLFPSLAQDGLMTSQSLPVGRPESPLPLVAQDLGGRQR
jgi:uncharacterized membrane protein YagU involved in acid resistance